MDFEEKNLNIYIYCLAFNVPGRPQSDTEPVSCVEVGARYHGTKSVRSKCIFYIDILETRSSPHKGTTVADKTSKMITEMAYRW